jgi:hypothetical protein
MNDDIITLYSPCCTADLIGLIIDGKRLIKCSKCKKIIGEVCDDVQ